VGVDRSGSNGTSNIIFVEQRDERSRFVNPINWKLSWTSMMDSVVAFRAVASSLKLVSQVVASPLLSARAVALGFRRHY
jgi:hypothetical protein